MGRRAPAGAGKLPRPFRLTPAARTTDQAWLHGLTEDTAYEFVKEIRFRDNAGEPFCPHCMHAKAYEIASRRRFTCAACRKQFSVTSGTIFHSRKLSYLKLVKIVFQFADCAKGASACELGIKNDLDYKSIFVALHKLREAMASNRDQIELAGTIEMDAAWFGGKVRKKNKKADRQLKENDRRAAEHRAGKRVIMVARQRDGDSAMFAADSETREVALAAARGLVRIDADTKFVTDQELAYRDLGFYANHEWVNHKREYDNDGVNTNLAESSFSRARRAEIGVYHHWSPTWLDFYAGEICWRENRRRLGNMQQAEDIFKLALAHPQSRNLKGYWQNHLLPGDQNIRGEIRLARVHAQPALKPQLPAEDKARNANGTSIHEEPVTAQVAEPFHGYKLPQPPPPPGE